MQRLPITHRWYYRDVARYVSTGGTFHGYHWTIFPRRRNATSLQTGHATCTYMENTIQCGLKAQCDQSPFPHFRDDTIQHRGLYRDLDTAPRFHMMGFTHSVGATHGQYEHTNNMHSYYKLAQKKSPVRKIFFANWRNKTPQLNHAKSVARRRKIRCP